MTIRIEDLNISTTLDSAESAKVRGGFTLVTANYWSRLKPLSGKRRQLVLDTRQALRMRNEDFFIPATGWTDPVGP